MAADARGSPKPLEILVAFFVSRASISGRSDLARPRAARPGRADPHPFLAATRSLA
jgi:hypothetical protein